MRTVAVAVDEVLRETDLAFLFAMPSAGVIIASAGDPDDDEDDEIGGVLDDDRERVWVPKSVIEDADDITVGDEDLEVNVAEWFAEKEGLS